MNLMKLIFRKPKHRCQFYGFNLFGHSVCFVGLKKYQYMNFFGNHNFCRMQVSGEIPDWNKCILNSSNEQERMR